MAGRVSASSNPLPTIPSTQAQRGAEAFDAIARRAVQMRMELDALAEAKTPQSGWALLNPATSIRMIAGHYDNVRTIHEANVAKLQSIELGAKVGAVVMRRHDLSLTDIERMDVQELGRIVGVANAVAIKECLSYAQGRAPEIDTEYLSTVADIMAEFVGEQVREARAFDEKLKTSNSVVDRAVGHASAAVLDTVSDANAEAKQAFAVADDYWTAPSRKDTFVGHLGHGATFAGEMVASTVTMPATIADVRATDEERSQAIVGTAMMLGTIRVIKGGGPAWSSLGNGVKKGAATAMMTRPVAWIAESSTGRVAGRAIGRTAEVLGKAEARLEATAFAKSADRAKAALAKINRLPSMGGERPAISEASYEPLPAQGRRKTVGRSGTPTATPPADQPHLAAIHRGIERMPTEVRLHLEMLLDGGAEGRAIQAGMREIETEIGRVGVQIADAQKTLAAGETTAIAKIEALAVRTDELAEKYALAEVQLETAQAAVRPKAVEVMDYYLKSIRRSTADAKKLAARVPIEDDAIHAVAKHLRRTPEHAEHRIRSWLTDYFETADPRLAPEKLRIFFDPADRAYYLHGKGINVGKSFNKATLFHEMTHPMEHVDPAIGAATKAWRNARAAAVDPGMATRPLNDLVAGATFKPDEVAFATNDFVKYYVGKVYPRGPSTEVLTIFAEHLADAESAVTLLAQDPEHFFLGLGLLR